MFDTQLWPAKSAADLIETPLEAWPTKLEVLVIRFNFMLPHKHEIVWLHSVVAQGVCCKQTLDVLDGLASVLFLVDFLIFLPHIDLNVVCILFDGFIAVALLSTLGLLNFVVTLDNIKTNHVADHGSCIASQRKPLLLLKLWTDQ